MKPLSNYIIERLNKISDESKARQFVSEVIQLSKKYGLNCFVITDGASGISNNGNPAIAHARKCHTEWERSNGIDPNHDWTNEI